MPRYYCDYCDTYLTHDSPSVRKQHNAGYKHKANVRSYYQQFEEQQTQSLIDQRIKEHLGQAAAFQQVGATFNQRLPIIPRLPILPPPILPMGTPQPLMTTPMVPGVRPPLLPRPISAYPGAPAVPGPTAPHSGAASMPMPMPMPMSSLPGPPPLAPPPSGPSIPLSANSAPAYYQADPSVSLTATAAPSSAAAPQDGSSHSQPSETNP